MELVLPSWDSLQHGNPVNVVLQTLLVEDSGILSRTVTAPFQKVWVKGDIPNDIGSTFVLVHAKVIEVSPVPVVEAGHGTSFFNVPPCTSIRLKSVVELCSGIGVFSSVAPQFLMKSLAGVDCNHKWQGMYEALHPGSKYIVGDVADSNVISQLLHQDAFFAWVVAGISCQPHSRGGDRKGMSDVRASSLQKVLHTSWLMQSPMVILECVADIMQDATVQSILRQYCQATGCCLTQKVLKLSDAWPTARTRWFAILTSPLIGAVHVEDLPVLGYCKIQDIMPFIRHWPEDHHEQLQLTLYELAKYYQYATGGIESHYIKMDGTLATCLHSAGNQLYACRCGCRGPFTLQRLASKGLFATLIPLKETIKHADQWMRHCRFLHPSEMMMLQGGNPDFAYDSDMRLCLAAIGQCVSPIHACWIFAHAVNAIRALLREPLCDPLAQLRQHVDNVLQSRDRLWTPDVVMNVAEQEQMHEIRDQQSDTAICFKAVGPVTVDMFKHAESILQGSDPMDIVVVDCDGNLVSGNTQVVTAKGMILPSFQQPPNVGSNVECVCACPCEEWGMTDTVIDSEVSPTIPFVVKENGCIDQGAALAEIPMERLLAMLCPVLHNTQEVGHMLKQTISKQTRLTILEHQHHVWADDEIRFFLQQVTTNGPTEMALFVWDPLILSCVIRHCKFDLLQAYAEWIPTTATILTAVSIEQHWYPIVWQWQHGGLICFTCGHACNFSMAIHSLHNAVCRALGCEITAVQHYPVRFPVTACCGAMVLAFMDFVVFNKPLPKTFDELTTRHAEHRRQFVEHMPEVTSRPWIWGQGEPAWQQKLGLLLQEHGVAASDVAPRIAMLKDMLGGALIRAIEAPAPWRELKWIANSHMPPIQIIKPSELQSAIDRKVQQGGDVGNKSQKKKAKGKAGGKGKSTPSHVDPASLRIEHGLFECGEGIPLGQVEVANLGPTVSGVVICNWAQAAPYLRSGKQVSAGGLAMILVDVSEGVQSCPLIAEPVRVPMICQANCEPALIDGVMYQLGQLPVRRRDNPDKFELVTISSSVVKVMIFRDQVEGSWEQVIAHPLRYVFARIPCFQACQDEECPGSCEAWHSSEQCRLQDPILELWAKQYIRLNFQPVPPNDAEVFQVMIRIPHCMQTQVQTYSGLAGIFLEPRSVTGKQPSDHFQVVWVPRGSYDEIRMLKQTVSGVLGLARLGSKYGLRCLAEHASGVHKVVKPGSSWLPPGRKQTYVLGPVPFGTLKTSITQMIQSIQWQARAIQPTPAAAHVQGIMWKVQAVEAPGQMLIHTAHGDVLISKMTDAPEDRPARSNIIAARSTVSLCTEASSSSTVDPLQTFDPWASAVRQGTVAPSKPSIVAEDPVELLQQKVLDAVIAKFPPSMELDGESKPDGVARIESLEQRVADLSNGQQQLHNMMMDQSAKHNAQVTHLQQQTSQLEHSVHDHSLQLGSFQQQFKAQLDQQQTHLDTLLGQQMARLEEMLGANKKPRME